MIDFKGKTVLVTGGGSGIGRGIAEAFSDAGARIVIADIKPELVAEMRKSLDRAGVEALVIEGDMTREADVQALAQRIDSEFGGLDVLVNNVGDFVLSKRFEEFSDDEISRLYDLNLRHIFSVTRAMLPLLRKRGQGSSIVSISSIEGLRGAAATLPKALF